MKHVSFYVTVALSMLFAEAREALVRGFFALSSVLRKVFLPTADASPGRRKGSPFTKERLRYFVWLARAEITAARDLGARAKECLREGYPGVARLAARGAYSHWRKARKAFARFSAAA
jgi:hypothetical protein